MGAKVQIENYLAGHYSMRDLSRDSNGASWPPCFGDNNLANGQFYYGFLPRTVADTHSGYDRDVVKQTMLEHEAIFKNQVYELHRLYQVQRDLMDEVKRKEQYEQRTPYETSSSSSPVLSHMKSEDVRRWNGSTLPFANSVYGRPEAVQSSPQSVKGKSIQASPASFQNGHSPRNSEVSESRPIKLRRMLDLTLPADEYIDPDEAEEVGDSKVFDNVGPFPDKNGKVAPLENGKLFPNHHTVRTECSSRLDSHVSKSKALADLNEPIYVEETADSSANFVSRVGGHNDVKHWDLPTKSSIGSKDIAHNSIHGSAHGDYLKNYHPQNRPSVHDSFRYALESEQQKSSLRFMNQGFHTEKGPKPLHPVNALLDQTSHQPPVFASVGDHFRGDPWKAKSVVNIEKSDRNYSLSNYNKPEPTMASHLQNQTSLYNSADLGKPWDQCGSSWEKPSGGLTQHSTPTKISPFLASGNLNKSPLQSSGQSDCFFGGKWNLNCAPGGNGTFDCEPYPKNGFFQGAASNACFREVSAAVSIPQVGYDSGKNLFKGAASVDVKPMKDVNLNVALPDDPLQDQKSEDPLAVLPWLRGKAAHLNKPETSNKKPESTDCPSSRRILGVHIFENLPTPKRENCTLIDLSVAENHSAKEEAGPSGRKFVFDMNAPCELSDSEAEKTGCEQDEKTGVVEKKIQTESVGLKNHFDLNSCITEEEIPIPCTTPPAPKKVDSGIDLEALIVLEDDYEPFVLPREEESLPSKEPEKLPEVSPCRAAAPNDGEEEEASKLAKLAAEAIIAISSVQPREEVIQIIQILEEETDLGQDPLHWFVSIACCSTQDNSEDCLPKELDDFESMTLRLKECTFDEYFPKPSIPEFPNMQQGSTRNLTARTRKGQARRGRQRRDFQRDILPGLTSLSRHEVTEDMQTFGGLMRATGYDNWQCGPNRRNATRNGSGRGRRRAVVVARPPAPESPPAPVHTVSVPTKQQQQQQQLLQQQINSNNTEGGLEDRSLTGWGKTTRRPRRQRLPAGNLTPPVPLS